MARGAALFQALCRLFALGLTMMFVLSICGIWLDLVAWRCATDTGCRARHPGLQAVADGWLAAPGRRLCVAALAPIAVVGFLWWLGRRTWLRYETYQGPATGTGGSGLASGTFWDLRRPVARLRSLHVTTALTSIDVLVLVALLDHTGAPGRFLLAASLLLEATVLGLACRAPGGGVRDVRWMDSVCRAVRTAALALTICVLALSAAVADRFPTVGGMPGYALLVDWLTGAEVALLLVLAAVTLAGRGYAGKVLLGGLGAVLAGSAATGIGSAFGAALYFQVQGFLGLAPGAGVGVVPVFYTWSALGFAVLVIVAALLAGVAQLVTISNLRRQARAFTDADYPDVRRRDLLRAVTIDDAIARAKLTDFVPRLFAVGYAPVAIGGCAAAICAMAGILPTRLLASAPQLADLVAALTTVGRFAVGLMALGLLLLGLLAYRFPWTRRSVGILWDAATFWPRLAHPFGPPCYANRIVNEVAIRSQWMAEGGGLVLSGHGHGALLAIAALLRMDPAPAARTALLTTGAPTRRIFGRLFPAYLDQSLFDLVGTRLATGSGHARWINLWRGTDPVGGPVGEPADDRRIPDPGGAYPLPGDSAYPPIDGNADYDTAPGYRLAVQDLVGALASSRAPG